MRKLLMILLVLLLVGCGKEAPVSEVQSKPSPTSVSASKPEKTPEARNDAYVNPSVNVSGEVVKKQSLHPDAAVLCGSVVEVTDTAMLVECYPEDEDCDCLGLLVTVPIEGISPAPQIGDIAEIQYDGILKECYPQEPGEIYNITMFYSKVECGASPEAVSEIQP